MQRIASCGARSRRLRKRVQSRQNDDAFEHRLHYDTESWGQTIRATWHVSAAYEVG